MKGKGKQPVPYGGRVHMAFPGGAGYGDPRERDPAHVRRDLALGYITAEVAAQDYGLSPTEIADIEARAVRGEDL